MKIKRKKKKMVCQLIEWMRGKDER